MCEGGGFASDRSVVARGQLVAPLHELAPLHEPALHDAMGQHVGVRFDEFQALIDRTYGDRDRARGQAASVAWLAEEVGELAKAARKGSRDEQLHELGDVIAWVTSLANQLDLSITEAISRFASGCPKCAAIPCHCAP